MNRQSGQVSRIIIFIAAASFIILIAAYGFSFYISGQRARQQNQPKEDKPLENVYDAQFGDIRFLFVSAEDLGDTLKSLTSYEDDIKTSDRFIRVVIGAQNVGKTTIKGYSWDIGDIVDSTGRHFTNINNKVYNYLPRPDLCQSELKPQFSPALCVKYYEVSRVSTSLKIQVKVSEPKKAQGMLDIIIK